MKIGRVTINLVDDWLYIDSKLYGCFSTFKERVREEHPEIYKAHIISTHLTKKLTIKHKVNWEAVIHEMQNKDLL